MRAVFLGTPELAVPSLAAVAAEHEVAAVVCQPDRPRGRGKRVDPPPVKVWAVEHGIPVAQPSKLNDGAFEAWLREQAPDICVIAAYGRLLKQPILDVPPKGFINMHPSLLPKYRGPSPIQSAVIHGETVTGVTIMRLTLEMDSGDIVLQEEVSVGPDETAVALTERLAGQGGRLLAEAMRLIASGQAAFRPQDPAQATYCRLLTKEDGRIRWGASSREIHNLVRGALPWPVAHCGFRGEVCRIHATRMVDGPAGGIPGAVTAVADDGLSVATGDGSIAVLALQMPGKRVMPVAEYLRGHPIAPGERFEDL